MAVPHTFTPTTGNRRFSLGFWILVTAIFLYDRTYLITKASLPYFLLCSVVRIALLVGLAWLNMRRLVPRYLLTRRYGSYFLSVLLLVCGYLVIQSLYDYYLFGFIIGPGRGGRLWTSLAYNFTHTSLYLVLTVAFKFSIDWYELQKQINEMKVGKLQAEVSYLRSQVNPHFLFNALNNLYGLTLRKSDLAPEMVLRLSGLMEYMLYESNEEYVPLEKETGYISDYLELERLRLDHRANIRLTVTGETAGCRVPPFLLLPLVENAVKHGISQGGAKVYLHVQLEVGQGRLSMTVANSKPGSSAQEAKKGGIGLLNLRRRLELLYPGKHELLVSDRFESHTVTLKIPVPC